MATQLATFASKHSLAIQLWRFTTGATLKKDHSSAPYVIEDSPQRYVLNAKKNLIPTDRGK